MQKLNVGSQPVSFLKAFAASCWVILTACGSGANAASTPEAVDPHRPSHCSAAENAALTLQCANLGFNIGPLDPSNGSGGGGHGLISSNLGATALGGGGGGLISTTSAPAPLGTLLGGGGNGGDLTSVGDLGALEAACAEAAQGIAIDQCH